MKAPVRACLAFLDGRRLTVELAESWPTLQWPREPGPLSVLAVQDPHFPQPHRLRLLGKCDGRGRVFCDAYHYGEEP